MINYIFEMLCFIAAIVMYGRGETTPMIAWLFAGCILGMCAVIAEVNRKSIKISEKSDKEETK